GSLRQAIICANAVPGTHTISFNIPGSGVHTIAPTTDLPAVKDAVIIDGYTQPGASPNTLAIGDNAKLMIEINGEKTHAGGQLLEVDGNSTLRGLIINRKDEGSALLVRGDHNVIEGSFIGTNAAGTAADDNSFASETTGVSLDGATNS